MLLVDDDAGRDSRNPIRLRSAGAARAQQDRSAAAGSLRHERTTSSTSHVSAVTGAGHRGRWSRPSAERSCRRRLPPVPRCLSPPSKSSDSKRPSGDRERRCSGRHQLSCSRSSIAELASHLRHSNCIADREFAACMPSVPSPLSHRANCVTFRLTKNWLNVFSCADDKHEYELRDYRNCLVAATFLAGAIAARWVSAASNRG